jgi:hypothetical protein
MAWGSADWKLHQPLVKIVEYANFLADVLTRLITDADAEVGRWKEFLEKSSQLPPTDRARVYNALEAWIATEAGNGQLQLGGWQTLRNITGQRLSSRTLLGRFLFEESNCYRCKRIDRYQRDIGCNYPNEGASNQLLNLLRLLPSSCYFDRGEGHCLPP